ncbi:hypothetical protein QT970_26365, partial [Microcoleus sp. herbarium8]
ASGIGHRASGIKAYLTFVRTAIGSILTLETEEMGEAEKGRMESGQNGEWAEFSLIESSEF